ncbi:hypothetical protein FIBSPDRAFT_963317 [Athelia psychrophila]|uniref:Exportin-2 central domain-containing protein n=1 Tax=Athelia psychrophila TaxID=1759441 RepID=A0A165Z549_9AGAM|nr:hypothetical protein FIBSPDRAFT_963317 [Fibularhizoctonia sp. CBS 109695]
MSSDLPSLLLASLHPASRKQAEQSLTALTAQPGFISALLQLVLGQGTEERSVHLVIAALEFPERWPDLINQLTTSLSPTDTTTNASVLETAHSIFAPWRAHVRSDALFSEINYVLSRFMDPFLQLFRHTAGPLPPLPVPVSTHIGAPRAKRQEEGIVGVLGGDEAGGLEVHAQELVPAGQDHALHHHLELVVALDGVLAATHTSVPVPLLPWPSHHLLDLLTQMFRPLLHQLEPLLAQLRLHPRDPALLPHASELLSLQISAQAATLPPAINDSSFV